MEISADQSAPMIHQDTIEDLVEKIDDFSIFDPTQTPNQPKEVESNLDRPRLSERASKTSGIHAHPLVLFALGLRGTSDQESISKFMPSAAITKADQEIPLIGAQQGLVLTATSEGNIVHWLGT